MLELSGVLISAQRLVLRQMALGSDFRETLSLIVRSLEQINPSLRANILYFEAKSGTLRAGGNGKLPAAFIQAVDGITPGPLAGCCGSAAFRRRRVISRSIPTDPLWVPYRDLAAAHGIRSACSTPLLSQKNGALLGVLGIYHSDEGHPSAADLQIADHFSELATVALERVFHENELKRLAREDTLTGVLNRRAILDSLTDHLSVAQQNGEALSVAMLDVDYFQFFNHILGHRSSDEILTAIATRLRRMLPEGCQVGRLSADQFLLFAPAPGGGCHDLATRVLDACRSPLPVGEESVSVSVTIAVDAGAARPGASVETILDQLAFALTRRSELGRNCIIPVNGDDHTRIRELRQIRATLNDAVANQLYEPFFQPIFDLETGACVGFEAMIRFQAAIDMPIPQTLDLAAASPMLEKLNLRMFERICDLVKLWRTQIGHRYIAVNISAAQLIQRDVAARMRQIVTGADLSPRQFYLEIAPDRLDPASEPLRPHLQELRDAGFRLALDGLENGTASLRSLLAGQFEMVKIGKVEAFTGSASADLDTVRKVIYSTARSVAAAAKVPVCAKNIESAADWNAARAAGFRFGQGFYWSKALPIEEVLTTMASEQPAANRRQEPRNLCASLATVFWEDAAGGSCCCEANVLDISTRGIGIQTDEAVPAGTRVRIQWKDNSLTGQVRHVQESAIGPIIGVEFDDHSRWSELLLSPEYMLNS